MSSVRKIDFGKFFRADYGFHREGVYQASAEIFQDTENLALCIHINNTETNEITISRDFNIEKLGLDESTEDWLALIIAINMMQSVQAGREEKTREIKNAWDEFQSSLQISLEI